MNYCRFIIPFAAGREEVIAVDGTQVLVGGSCSAVTVSYAPVAKQMQKLAPKAFFYAEGVT